MATKSRVKGRAKAQSSAPVKRKVVVAPGRVAGDVEVAAGVEDSGVGQEHSSAGAEGATSSVVAVESSGVEHIDIAVPVAVGPIEGYSARHVDCQLSLSQAETLRRIQDGLAGPDFTLKTGRCVGSPADAVKWLIEQVG